jgi:hypothetical protein
MAREIRICVAQRRARRRLGAATAGGVLAYTTWLGLGVAVGACGDDTATTGRERVSFATRITIPDGGTSFQNAFAFQVELERALVSVGPLYFHEGAPLALSPPANRKAPLAPNWLGVASAWAHPGHYVEGETLGEMLTPTSVDLVTGMAGLADGAGVTGTALSGSFSFYSPPTGPFADVLAGHVAVIEGTATRDAATLAFRATADESDVMNTQGEPVIIGCTFEAGEITGDGTVTVTVDLPLWLDQIDFELVTPNADGSRVELPRGEPPHNAFVRGLEKAAGYSFTFSPATE